MRVSRELGDGGLGARTVRTVRRVQRYTCGEKTPVGRTDGGGGRRDARWGNLSIGSGGENGPRRVPPLSCLHRPCLVTGKKAKPPGRWTRVETLHKQRGAQRINKGHCKIIDGATGTKTCEWFIPAKKKPSTPPGVFHAGGNTATVLLSLLHPGPASHTHHAGPKKWGIFGSNAIVG